MVPKKHIVNMLEMLACVVISVIILLMIPHFLYHNIATICGYHDYHESLDHDIIYHDYCGITTLYITATQAKDLDSLYQVQLGVFVQPYSVACVPYGAPFASKLRNSPTFINHVVGL